MTDACSFDYERQIRPAPFQLRFYSDFDYMQVSCTLLEYYELYHDWPPSKRKLIDRVKSSIADEGMRNPLIVEWYTQDPRWPVRWMTTVGNNRHVALHELGVKGCPALICFPTSIDTPELSGDYEELSFLAALARFDAAHPWWHSVALKQFAPCLIPKGY